MAYPSYRNVCRSVQNLLRSGNNSARPSTDDVSDITIPCAGNTINLTALEDRVLFDAAPVTFDVDGVSGSSDLTAVEFSELVHDNPDWASAVASGWHASESWSFAESFDRVADRAVASIDELESLLQSADGEGTTQLVVIDRSLDDYQQLLESLRQDHENLAIVFVDGSDDGMAVISRALNRLGSVSAIHVFSHADDGQLQLGKTNLSGDSLDDYAWQIGQWRDSLTANADILFYGCNLAASEDGEQLLEALARLTGADIAASEDLTGHRAMGGDWTLEYTFGEIQTDIVSPNLQAEWWSVLALVQADGDVAITGDAETTIREHRGSAHAVAMDDNGNHVVVWSRDTASSGWEIIGQKYDYLGVAEGGEFTVNQASPGDQTWASVGMDADGNFVVTWTDQPTNSVMARLYFTDGTDSGEFVVGSNGLNSSVSMNDDGRFVIVWEGSGVGDSAGVYASYFDTDGSTIRNNFLVNSTVVGLQDDADVSIDSSGNFAVTWEDNGIWVQRFASDGSHAGGETQVVANAGWNFVDPTVELRDDGKLIAASTFTNGLGSGVWAWILDGGNNIDRSFRVNQTVVGMQSDPSIASVSSGEFLITWWGFGAIADESDVDGGVFARKFGADGSALNGEYRINNYTTGIQQFSSLAAYDLDTYVVVWSGEGALDASGVFIKRIGQVNQMPTAGGTIDATQNNEYVFQIGDFNYSDVEGSPLDHIRINALPTDGQLLLDGVAVSTGDTITSAAIAAGRLTYLQTTVGYGTDFDHFHFRAHDGDRYSRDSRLDIDVNPINVLWLSTDGEVSDATGVPGPDAWDDNQLLQFGGSDLQFEPLTDGEFSFRFSLQPFSDKNLSALHYVTQSITIGSFTLNEGDLLFAMDGNDVLPGIGDQVREGDIVIFRPTSSDYSTGNFGLLVDQSSSGVTGAEMNISKLSSLTLVESDTLIGDHVVKKGQILFSKSGSSHNSIYVMTIDEIGENTTVATAELLIDGDDINISEDIVGLELIERDTEAGRFDLFGGQLLVSLDSSETPGNLGVFVRPQDIFVLDVVSTSYDGATAFATSSLFFDGSDVGFVNGEGDMSIDALSLIVKTPFVNLSPTVSDQTFLTAENTPDGTVIGRIAASDPNRGDPLTFTVIGGTGAAIFNVHAETGDISVAREAFLDYELATSFTLDVVVSDYLGDSDTATITINLIDLIENSISGTLYNDVDADGQFADDMQTFENALVYLVRDVNGDGFLGNFDMVVRFDLTDSQGRYSFNGLADDQYFVVVDSKTLAPFQGLNGGFALGDVWAQQTFGSAGSLFFDGTGDAYTNNDGALFGGRQAGVSDDLSDAATAQHITRVSVSGANVNNVDSAFSFNVVTNLLGGDAQDDDLAENRRVQGSMRQFIQNANAIAGGNVMRFVPAVEANQLSRSTWRISVSDALPAITDGGTVIDGQAYSSADGNLAIDLTSNRIGPNGAVVGVSQNALPVLDQPELELRNAGGIAYGLFVDADNVEIHRMRIQAFGDPAARNSANIYVHDADGFQLTESHLRGAGSGNLIVSGGNGGLIEHNLIAAAGRFGILLDGATTTSNWVIRKNTIRNNALLRPSGDGIGIQDDANDIFVVMNLLIGNAGSGVDTWQNPGDVIISENTIRRNGWGGVETAGVRLFGSDNVVANNVITDNGGAGVLVLGNTGQANTPANSNLITQNHFGGNGTIAIDLTEASGDPAVMNHGDGITSNFVDPVQSGNEGISRPVITSSNFDGTTTTVAGMAGANQRVEIYLAVSDSDGSDNLAGDSFGEGVRYLGWVMTDGAGAFSFATTDLTAADAVTALAIDSSNNTSEFAKNIEVNAIPTSNDSSIWLRINDSFTFAVSDFNFSDADGDSIHHVTIDSLPTNGTLTIGGLPVTAGMQIDASDIAAGDLVYSAPGITGTPLTSFDFAVSDGTASSVNYTMAIDVLPPNAPPTILAPSHISVAENDSFVTDVDAVDPENDSLTFGLGSSGDESFFTINANSGKISFVLPPDFESPQDANGDNTYEIEVLVDDNNNNIVSKTIEVHVQPINDNTPVLDLDPRYFVDENTNYVTHAQATDADLPAQSLSYSIDPSFLDGALFQIDSSTGEIQFVSSPDFEKPLDGNKDNTYRIRVSVSDGMGKSDSVAIRITVRDVNEPITDISLADDDVLENSAGGTRIGFVQVDEPDAGDTHTFQLLNDASDRFQIDANTGELTVQPNADLDFEAQQVHTIEVRVSDGVKYSFIKKFQIHVIDVNEKPVAIDDAFIVNEGGILVKSNGETLANDSDPDGDTLSGMIVNGPSFGQLNWSTDGSFVYVHDGSETTLDSFQYRVSDGRGGFDVATVMITINPVNDAPVANDDVIAAGETQSVLINPGDLLANDSDVDSTNLAVVVVANPSTGQLIQQPDGSLIFIPDANTPGIATFAYVASDGQDVSQPAVVTLIVSSPTNDPGEQSTDPPETNSQTDDGGTEPPDGENPGENPGGGEGRSQPGDESDLSPDGDNHAGFAESIEMHDEEDSQVADSFSENQRVSGSLLSTNYAFTYQKTSIDLSSLFGRSSGTSPFGELAPLDSSLAIASMWNELDHVNDVLAKNLIVSTGTIATAASLTGVLTVGYVLWMARGGLLVASLVSSVPAWQSFDPLPVLQYAAEEDNDEETESIESLLNQE